MRKALCCNDLRSVVGVRWLWRCGRGKENPQCCTYKGQKVGEDAQGNIYYQTADGKKRWVIYNGEIEASRVAPDWHGWLHFTWDQPPSQAPLLHKAWELPHLENLTGTAAAYAPPGSIRSTATVARATQASRTDYEAWTPEQ